MSATTSGPRGLFKAIPGFAGCYWVSTCGLVWSEHKQGLVSPQRINSGYLVVHLYDGGRRMPRLVHRLVAQAFLPEDPSRVVVNHINGDKTDNRVLNLEWATRSENMRHAHAVGLANAPRKAVVGRCATTGAETRFASQVHAELFFTGRRSSAIHHCLTGKKKSAYGHVWRREE